MNRAVDLSIQNVLSQNGGPFGAVIVQNNKIISEGVNSVVHDNDPTSHAEIVAIRKACKLLNTYSLSDCDIYSSTEPCPMCYAAIRWARIENIYYANTRYDADKIGFSDKMIYQEIERNKLKCIHKPHKKAIEAFQLYTKMNGELY
jgi:tRNA(Arg) A34 adenosine deaminase TadA